MELSLGNYVTFKTLDGSVQYRFQNFYINKTTSYDSESWSFLPFGFSGVSINRNGDNTDSSIVLPNNRLSRAWALEAVRDTWLATVYVMVLDPDNVQAPSLMHQYIGQTASGKWDETSLTLTLNTVLDAVGGEIPQRRITQALVGNIPVSPNVRLR
jgi:hypothetical protein